MFPCEYPVPKPIISLSVSLCLSLSLTCLGLPSQTVYLGSPSLSASLLQLLIRILELGRKPHFSTVPLLKIKAFQPDARNRSDPASGIHPPFHLGPSPESKTKSLPGLKLSELPTNFGIPPEKMGVSELFVHTTK